MLGPAEIAIIAFFVLLTLVVIVGYTLPRWRARSAPRKRTLQDGSDGQLIAVGDVERDVPIHFSGSGAWSSKPTMLEPGSYRLSYDFSPGVPVRVGLASPTDGGEETLLIKSGSGVEGFTVEEAGRYLFLIQPADENAEWAIECQHLTRYGVQDQEDNLSANHDRES